MPARTEGHDALRGKERIQIKGRAYGDTKNSRRISKIKLNAPCDTVLLVLLDNSTMEPREMWEAPYGVVCECLSRRGSKAQERGALGVPAFKKLARRIIANRDCRAMNQRETAFIQIIAITGNQNNPVFLAHTQGVFHRVTPPA